MSPDCVVPDTCHEDPNVDPEPEIPFERKPIEPMWEAVDCQDVTDDPFYDFD